MGTGTASPPQPVSAETSCTSPETEETPSRISCLNPDETATAIIITRKLTAMETIAMFPLKLILFAINLDASMRLLPYYHPFILRAEHGITLDNPEGIEECLQVAQSHIYPVLSQ